MRSVFYLLTVASCLVLAGIFYSRDQWTWMTIISLVAVIYVARGIYQSRKEGRGRFLEAERNGLSGEGEFGEMVKELIDSRDRSRLVRQRHVAIGFLIMIMIVITYPSNAMLAFAMSVFLLPLVYLIIRGSQVIREIENGLELRDGSGRARS